MPSIAILSPPPSGFFQKDGERLVPSCKRKSFIFAHSMSGKLSEHQVCAPSYWDLGSQRCTRYGLCLQDSHSVLGGKNSNQIYTIQRDAMLQQAPLTISVECVIWCCVLLSVRIHSPICSTKPQTSRLSFLLSDEKTNTEKGF